MRRHREANLRLEKGQIRNGTTNLLVFEHLNGMVPSHSSVGCSASDKDNFGLSILGKVDGLAGVGAGSGLGNSVSVDESGGSSGCEREHGGCK